MNLKIRWKIVGAGNIAPRFAKTIRNADDAKLIAISSDLLDFF